MNSYRTERATRETPAPDAARLQAELAEARREIAVLRERAERLRMMIENEPECVKVIARDGELLEMNPAGLAMLEAESLDEARTRPLVEFVAPEHRAAFIELHRRVMAGERMRLEFEVVGLRGGRRWLETHASPQRDKNGGTIALLGITRDVTDWRRAEAALRETEARLKLALRAGEIGTWDWDLATGRIVWSEMHERMWGLAPGEFGGTYAEFAARLHPDDRGRVEQTLQSALAAAHRFQHEFRVRWPDGTIRWISGLGEFFRDARGKAHRMVGVVLDFTERKQLEAQFLRAQRHEAIGTLATGVAHDLNNILAPVVLGAELLSGKLAGSADAALLDIIRQSGQRGADIVRQLLTFGGSAATERALVPTQQVLEEIGRLARETFPRTLQIDVRAGHDLKAIEGDATQLHQVLLNLCVNARDAMPDGGTLTLAGKNVQLTAADAYLDPRAQPGDWVELAITDTGHGIPLEILHCIFDPFFTTKPVGRGSGLGLSTALGIVKSHGGFMRVDSTSGQGATFRVYLPAAIREAASVPVSSGAKFQGDGAVVLLVDDEPPVREMLATALRRAGYEVLTASNGQEGLLAFLHHRERVRFVLSDVTMPVMDGVKLALALRDTAPDLPIALTSGIDLSARLAQLPSGTVTDFLPKPVRLDVLLETIGRHVRRG